MVLARTVNKLAWSQIGCTAALSTIQKSSSVLHSKFRGTANGQTSCWQGIQDQHRPEGMHEVCIALQWSPPFQQSFLVSKETDIFIVANTWLAISGPVSVEQARVFFPTLQHFTVKQLPPCLQLHKSVHERSTLYSCQFVNDFDNTCSR